MKYKTKEKYKKGDMIYYKKSGKTHKGRIGKTTKVKLVSGKKMYKYEIANTRVAVYSDEHPLGGVVLGLVESKIKLTSLLKEKI